MKRAVLFVLLLLIFAFFAEIFEAQHSAERIAGNDPYCVQISGGADYREVASKFDLSIFEMSYGLFDTGILVHHHGVMVIEKNPGQIRLLHWSYRRGEFVDGALGPPAIFCTPRPHFLSTLGESAKPASTFISFRTEGMAFTVPQAFRPSVMDNSRGMMFHATAPQFEPIDKPQDTELSYTEWGASVIDVYFGEIAPPIDEYLHKNGGSYLVKDAPNEAGLNKTDVWNLPSQKKSPSYIPSADYYARSADGRITTVINCPGKNEGDCVQTFYLHGWTYRFHHRQDLLPHWKEMQERLSSLTRSFVSAGQIISIQGDLNGNHLVSEMDWANPALNDVQTRPNTPN